MTDNAIAIIGAGFSGTVLALQLLRQTDDHIRIHLIERSGQFGPGLAYGTEHGGHLLNVPAGRMSAFPDRESDFFDWLHASQRPGEAAPTAATFAPRRQYGAYIRDRLREARTKHSARRLNLVHDTVIGIEQCGSGLTLRLESGAAMQVDAAVLANGNFPPAPVSGLCPDLAGTEFWCPNGWSGANFARLDPAASVLLLGTGLTMVDTVISLLDRGHTGPIHAVSRRGLLSRSHSTVPGAAPAATALPTTLRSLVRRLRRDAANAIDAGHDWQPTIDALRPHTQALWQALSLTERRRFLRHLRPFWDVHRHRMAPEIARRIDAAQRRGQLRIHAGRVAQVAATDNAVTARIALRGGQTTMTLAVARVVNCTGLAADITQVRDPLLRGLLDDGLVSPDPLRLGLDVTETGCVRASDGSSSGRLLAIGPLTKGVWWEIVAVPDIRRQCATVARHLADMMTPAEREIGVLASTAA